MTHRVRIGLTGLACVFLLVMLATAILRVADDGEGGVVTPTAAANVAAPAEPLAQLGVVPGNVPAADPAPAASAPAAPAPAAPATANAVAPEAASAASSTAKPAPAAVPAAKAPAATR